MKGRTPKVYSKTILGGTTYTTTNNIIDILGDVDRAAKFVQLNNKSNADLLVKMNGQSDAIFTLENQSSQVFNYGDLLITKLQFDNSASGAGSVVVEIIIGY